MFALRRQSNHLECNMPRAGLISGASHEHVLCNRSRPARSHDVCHVCRNLENHKRVCSRRRPHKTVYGVGDDVSLGGKYAVGPRCVSHGLASSKKAKPPLARYGPVSGSPDGLPFGNPPNEKMTMILIDSDLG